MSQTNQNEYSMFVDPTDEETLCQTLKAYVEEWGPDAVTVKVPAHWKDYGASSLGRVRLEYSTRNTVEIRVDYDSIRLEYSKRIKTAPDA